MFDGSAKLSFNPYTFNIQAGPCTKVDKIPIPKRDILIRRIPLPETQPYSFKQPLVFMKKSVKELYMVQLKPFGRLQHLGIEVIDFRM